MVVRAVLGLVLAVVMVAIAPGRAAACTCGSAAEGRAASELAFIGVVAGHVGKPITPYYNTGDPVTYTFAVESAIRGEPEPVVRILSAIEESACGIPMEIGQRWSIYASHWEGEYWTGICNGNTLLGNHVPVPPVPIVAGTVPMYPVPGVDVGLLVLLAGGIVIASLLAFVALDRRVSRGRRSQTAGTGEAPPPG